MEQGQNPHIEQKDSAEKKLGKGNPAWVPGCPSPNPAGRPKSMFQDYVVRAEILIEKHGRAGIVKIAKSNKLLNEQPGIDPIIIPALANIFNHKDAPEFSALERERLMDRAVGKPKSTVLHGGAPDEMPITITDHPTTPEQAVALYRQAMHQIAVNTPPQDEAPEK